MFDAASEVAKLNQWLKDSLIPVYVKLEGKTLALQATLPPKPGKTGKKRQQKIYLGIKANPDGIKRIRSEAQKLGSFITLGTFSWDLYLPESELIVKPKTSQQLIEEFREWYSRSHKIKDLTWRESWGRTFDRLPQNAPLTEAAILGVILGTEPHTRTRELTCQRLQKLADFAGVKVDLSSYRGEYSDRELKPRRIPTKFEIEYWRDKIPNDGWQWIYGVLASFGLRPHEAFFCEFDRKDRYCLKILEGKTDHRTAMAIHPEWVEEWNLNKIVRPSVTGRTYRDYGQRCYRQFQRYKIPFQPYDLRHAGAIELSVVRRLPVTVAASFLGHSPIVHQSTYHRWISESTNKQVWRELMMQPDDENS